MYVGSDTVLLTLDVVFDPDASAADVASAVNTLEQDIRAHYPRIKRIYIEAASLQEGSDNKRELASRQPE